MKISERLYMLELSYNARTICPALLSDGDKIVLVDTGFPGEYETLKTCVEKEGFLMEDISAVVFTHQDMDHIGCAKEIMQAHPGICFYAHLQEARHIDGSAAPVKMQKRLDAATDEKERAEIAQGIERAKGLAVPIDQYLEDGQLLPFAGGTRVVHTPGHTMGHVCLYVEKDRTLIAGDGLNVEAGRLLGPNPIHTYDMPMALESLNKLADLAIEQVLCYHGGLFKGDVRAALKGI